MLAISPSVVHKYGRLHKLRDYDSAQASPPPPPQQQQQHHHRQLPQRRPSGHDSDSGSDSPVKVPAFGAFPWPLRRPSSQPLRLVTVQVARVAAPASHESASTSRSSATCGARHRPSAHKLALLVGLLLAATAGLLAAAHRVHGLSNPTALQLPLQTPSPQQLQLQLQLQRTTPASGARANERPGDGAAAPDAKTAARASETAERGASPSLEQKLQPGRADAHGAAGRRALSTATANDPRAASAAAATPGKAAVKAAETAASSISRIRSQNTVNSSGSGRTNTLSGAGSSSSSSGGGAGGFRWPGGSSMLQQCLNSRYGGQLADWEDVGTVRPTVKVLGTWWSARNSSLPLTVVTQLSANRLQQLRAMCRAWHGPLSAVVYIPVQLEGPSAAAAVDASGGGRDGAASGSRGKAGGGRKRGRKRSAGGKSGKDNGGGGGGGRRLLGSTGGGSGVDGGGDVQLGPGTVTGRRDLEGLFRATVRQESDPGGRPGAAAANGSGSAPAAAAAFGGARASLGTRQLTLLRDTADQVRGFWQEMEQKRWCALDVMLVYEPYNDPRALRALYPVNMLRNWARLQARTPLIAMLDVDMLPSRGLLRDMRNMETARYYVDACVPSPTLAVPTAGNGHDAYDGGGDIGEGGGGGGGGGGDGGVRPAVFVLPAFQTANETSTAENIRIADRMANMTKAQLEVAVVLEAALPFHIRNFPAGHGATNYLRWFRTDEAYGISYARKFEPWFMAGRQIVPWHDARHRGYGHNKIIQVAAANATGAEFRVHPRAFLIHRPHSRSTARGELGGDAAQYRRILRAVMRNVTGTMLQQISESEAAEQQLQQQQEQEQQQQQLVYKRRLLSQEQSLAAAAAPVLAPLPPALSPELQVRHVYDTTAQQPLQGALHQKVIARKRAEAIIREQYRDKLRHNVFWTNAQVYREARIAMRSYSYVPVLDPGTAHCLSVLPWWRGGDGVTKGQ
ncbi:hypothetical protein PLESTM_000376800 [Pleodorina starrii]|nr:hypothetical protein PLESTM_000376800 [Pleodorina starrii]